MMVAEMLIALFAGAALGFTVACLVRSGAARAQVQALQDQLRVTRADLDRERADLHAAQECASAAMAEAAEARAMLDAERAAFERERGGVEQRMLGTFQQLANDVLTKSSEQFLGLAEQRLGRERAATAGVLEKNAERINTLLAPIKQDLERFSGAVETIEKQRATAFTELQQNVKIFGERQGELLQAISSTHLATERLSSALVNPKVAGSWGEISLEKIIELAGMTEHCDFNRQKQFSHEDGSERPDVIINLTDGLRIPVDAKVPLVRYQEACNVHDEAARRKLLQESATDLKGHVKTLIGRGYDRVDGYAGMTMLFVPVESMLTSALGAEPALLEYGAQHRIMICSPLLLLAYLQAFAHGWRMQKQRDNAERVALIGRRLYERMSKFASLFDDVGKHMDRAVRKYNETVGSFSVRLLPAGRDIASMLGENEKLEDVGAVDSLPRDMDLREPLHEGSEELLVLGSTQ
ncbi:MAG: DNA recombination protein RmuC [Vulcanimicrobiaceae bacterium]